MGGCYAPLYFIKMASKTDISNSALARIGEPPIMSLDDNTPRARACKREFELAVREVSRRHVWKTLKGRTELTELSTEPEFGWDAQYQLPSDFIRIVRLNGYDTDFVQDLYDIEGSVLLTDADEAKIEYIKYVEDTSQYDDMLVECVTLNLAYRIGTQILQDQNLSETNRLRYEQAIRSARKIDSGQNKRRRYDPTKESNFVKSRRLSTLT